MVAIFGVKLFIFGGLGVFEYPCFIDPVTNDVSGMYNGMIVSAISFALGFGMAFPLYKDEAPAPVAATTAPEPAASEAPTEVSLHNEVFKRREINFDCRLWGGAVAANQCEGGYK